LEKKINMRTKSKSRTQRSENVQGSKSQMIFAHRPAMTYVVGMSGLSPQEIVRGALPGYSNSGDSI
jgi:hypothetical protein